VWATVRILYGRLLIQTRSGVLGHAVGRRGARPPEYNSDLSTESALQYRKMWLMQGRVMADKGTGGRTGWLPILNAQRKRGA
jgi:hypothetical protein